MFTQIKTVEAISFLYHVRLKLIYGVFFAKILVDFQTFSRAQYVDSKYIYI